MLKWVYGKSIGVMSSTLPLFTSQMPYRVLLHVYII